MSEGDDPFPLTFSIVVNRTEACDVTTDDTDDVTTECLLSVNLAFIASSDDEER